MVEDGSMQDDGDLEEERQTGCCSECGSTFMQYGDSFEENKCPSCQERGGLPQTTEASPQLDPHSCSLCNKTFISSAHLTLHLATHNKDRKFRCSTCGKFFHQSSHLMTHKVIHSGDRPFKCPECGKTFGRASHLKTHRRLHTGEKPFKCTYCDKSFTQKAGLLAHVRLHTGERPYKCEKCGEGFRTLPILLAHKAEKSSGPEKRVLVAPQPTESLMEDLKCGVCCRTFVRSSYIRLHIRLKKGQRPYHCRVCNKTFVKLDSFVNHCEKHLVQKREKDKDNEEKMVQAPGSESDSSSPSQTADVSKCSKTKPKNRAEEITSDVRDTRASVQEEVL